MKGKKHAKVYMSVFISRFNKRLEQIKGTEPVFSFNKEILEEENHYEFVDYVIVGTLTPPDGREEKNGVRGFFYCSEKNKTYHYLDVAFGGNELENAKVKFRRTWLEDDKKEIKDLLRKRNILLLDVIDQAYSKIGKSEDKDIMRFTLDYDSFSKVDFSKVKVVIANSINAYEALEKISEDSRCESLRQAFLKNKVFIIPQQLRGYSSNPTNNPNKPTYITDSNSTATAKLEKDWKNFRDINYLKNRN